MKNFCDNEAKNRDGNGNPYVDEGNPFGFRFVFFTLFPEILLVCVDKCNGSSCQAQYQNENYIRNTSSFGFLPS